MADEHSSRRDHARYEAELKGYGAALKAAYLVQPITPHLLDLLARLDTQQTDERKGELRGAH